MAHAEIKSGRPLFSIIMPLFNKSAYVEKAISSVLCQTYNDWELIVVNDGSTDCSFDVALNVIERDSRCLIINQANAGVGAARNRGVAESQGNFLCFLDADDWWEPTILKEMALFVKDCPDAGLYATNYIYYKPGKTHVAVTSPTGYINYPKLYFESGVMPVWTGAVCLPRNSFDRYGGFPTGIKLGEDFLLWSKVAYENKVAFLNKPLAYYNNEIPPSQRATRHLYPPENHMLFNMDWLERRVSAIVGNSDWYNLMDMLRINGLFEYWLSKRYHQSAAKELIKVDWSRQSKSVIMKYKMPIWIMNLNMLVMKAGAFVKRFMRSCRN